jgi:hypothetical protein
MLERETEQIIALLIQRTIDQKAEVRLQDVLASRVPRGIKTYLRAEVTGWLTDELRQGRRMAGIVQGESLRGATASVLAHSASLEYVFPRAEFVTTLDQAVHFLGNYLCRPQWTLRQFLTPGGQPAPAAMIRQRLGYISEYSYIPALINGYIETRQPATISSVQLGALLEQIDRLVIQRGTFSDLARRSEPMFEFFSLASRENGEIPLKPLLVFLGDKNQRMLQDHLEQLGRSRSVSGIAFEDFVKSLAELDDDARIRAALYAPPPELREPEDPVLRPPVPLPPPPPPPAVEHESRNIPLSLTFAGIRETKMELPPLEEFIKDEQRFFFIEALFGKDPASYAAVIEAMNRIPSWNEAAGYMRGLFESQGIDPLSDEALELVEAVQLRYRAGRQ